MVSSLSQWKKFTYSFCTFCWSEEIICSNSLYEGAPNMFETKTTGTLNVFKINNNVPEHNELFLLRDHDWCSSNTLSQFVRIFIVNLEKVLGLALFSTISSNILISSNIHQIHTISSNILNIIFLTLLLYSYVFTLSIAYHFTFFSWDTTKSKLLALWYPCHLIFCISSMYLFHLTAGYGLLVKGNLQFLKY